MMVVRYTCKRCNTEIGSIPFDSARDVIRQLQENDEKEKERFLDTDDKGAMTVRCICEQCEQSLRMFPDLYHLENWKQ